MAHMKRWDPGVQARTQQTARKWALFQKREVRHAGLVSNAQQAGSRQAGSTIPGVSAAMPMHSRCTVQVSGRCSQAGKAVYAQVIAGRQKWQDAGNEAAPGSVCPRWFEKGYVCCLCYEGRRRMERTQ